MLTYLTLDHEVLDLSRLTEPEREFFDACYADYQADVAYTDLRARVDGPVNPLLCEVGGRITRTVREHPLYQALRDLEDRLGIRQGELDSEPGDDIDRDPIADEWLPTVQAAELKRVSLPGLHKAIERGVVIAAPSKPGGVRLVVSRNSLEHWTPDTVRQAARRGVIAAS